MGRPIKDYSQFKIGHMQPLYIDDSKPRGKGCNIYWICQCDCGNLKSINSSNLKTALRTNQNLSCGKCHAQIKDLTGQIFGKLKVLKRDDNYSPCKDNGWKVKWICQCECGNTVSIFGSNLTSLHTTSCGCINYSIGEQNIEQILKKHNIKFKKEYSFEDLRFHKKLRFDFAIFDNQNNLYELIEFDDRQHTNNYTPWNSNETLEERQYRDLLKNQYCQEHNIKLIRISELNRDKITINLLQLEELI